MNAMSQKSSKTELSGGFDPRMNIRVSSNLACKAKMLF